MEWKKQVNLLRVHSPTVLMNFFTAITIWLFGILVFTPLANSINGKVGAISSLIFFIAFTLFMFKTVKHSIKITEIFTSLLSKKYNTKLHISYEKGKQLFKNSFHIGSLIILYLLYMPFLLNFHPTINGIVLISVILSIFFHITKILSALSEKIIDWLRQ